MAELTEWQKRRNANQPVKAKAKPKKSKKQAE